jgi:putative glutamine amidotransferase
MSNSTESIRVGIYGPEPSIDAQNRGCGLWPVGYSAAVTASGGTPSPLTMPSPGRAWDDLFLELDGIVLLGFERTTARQAANEERLCRWCRDREVPILAVDHGLHALNQAFGGTIYTDLPRELPVALQHRHPPEPGVRHAITVENGTRLAQLYGEGEIVVNSEHTRAINKLARGFRVSGRALDGVIEAIEAETDGWFALGVQWHPGSGTASGLDIQLFRGLVEACRERRANPLPVHARAAA